jgi:hypothetical protein
LAHFGKKDTFPLATQQNLTNANTLNHINLTQLIAQMSNEQLQEMAVKLMKASCSGEQ